MEKKTETMDEKQVVGLLLFSLLFAFGVALVVIGLTGNPLVTSGSFLISFTVFLYRNIY